jgi:diguanylate cyclase (GGDEF)-like protein
MGLAQGSAFHRRPSAADTIGRRTWLARFGAEPPTFARQLIDRVLAAQDGQAAEREGVREAAEALGVLRAQHGHAIAGLVEDLVALRALLRPTPDTHRLVDVALSAATAAYVDELTAILEASATRDPLTGLPNRAAFNEAMAHEIAAASRNGAPALLLLDLDGFKGVNDTDGHLAGDAVLVAVAELLRMQVRAGDLACRLGGDEFAVVLPKTTQARALRVARRILTASHDAAGLASPSASVRLSIGVGWLETPADPEALIAVTDAALYAVKAAGGDDIQLSHEDDAESA